jgi:hypothetical protein
MQIIRQIVEWPLEMHFDGNEFTLNKKCVDKYTKKRSEICFQVIRYFENWRTTLVKVYSIYLENRYDNDSKDATSSEANVLV